MSHFTVLVIGPDPEKQLAPYHEYECTGVDDEYVQDVDMLAEWRTEYEERDSKYAHLSFPEWIRSWHSVYSWDGTVPRPKYSWFRVNEVGEVVEAIRRTNPNSKWDWYQLGGRWSGFFKLKGEGPDGRVDAALFQDIDFDGMRELARRQASTDFSAYYKTLFQFPEFKSWKEVWDGKDEALEAAREAYNAQPGRQELSRHHWSDPVGYFGRDPEAYEARMMASAGIPYAVVKDGKWHEKGQMGWFGMSSNDKEQDTWNAEVAALLSDLPPDTLLSLFDCHI